jgi:hypothetical protein
MSSFLSKVCWSQITSRKIFDLCDEGAALVDYSVTSPTLVSALATRVVKAKSGMI